MQLPDAFRTSVQAFADINPDFATYFKKCDSTTKRKDVLTRMSEYILNPKWTPYIVEYFSSDLLNILSLAIDFDKLQEDTKPTNENIVTSIALGLLLELHPDAESFVIKYYEISPAPFTSHDSHKQLKQKKTNSDYQATELDIVKTCLIFLQTKPDYFKNKWEWSTFFEIYSAHQSAEILYLTACCLAIYVGFNEKDLNIYLQNILPKTDIIDLQLQYSKKCPQTFLKNSLDDTTESSIFTSKNIVNIGGILLPVTNPLKTIEVDNLVLVDSTKQNLHKLALGVATNKAINLLGPVGCGKTTLVEYLAVKTGRKLGETFVKIQLGDQTDSKMLLGTYRCTDIPGEFVWQPGVLTQAILDGSWLLLEDIDSASMDIASVISGLIENQYLTVPGFRDFIGITPGFQLFTTQRLITTYTGHHKKYSNATTLLEKHVLSVNIQPLSYNELETIIAQQYPCLKTISPRMVSVFKRFTDNQEKLPRNSRLTSTRDLFKWCSRSIVDYEVHCQESALRLLQHAIDVFCSSYSDLNERLLLAKDVCAHLGVIGEKATYYCQSYQPTMSTEQDSTGKKIYHFGRGKIAQHSSEKPKVEELFCYTRSSACLLERIACCVHLKEPVLLVGETGTGKTSTVQLVANRVGQKLVVINMNQQSDSADLLGGYKPVDMKIVIKPLKTEFELAFCSFFNPSANKKFLSNLNYCFNEQEYGMLVKLMKKSCEAALNRLKHVKEILSQEEILSETRKRKALDEIKPKAKSEKELKDEEHFNTWTAFGVKLTKLEAQLKHKTALAFAFIEGSLVKAIREGYWVLLDEINLANAETLECLSGLLEGSHGSLSLLERGDKEPIKRHPDFMLFACMNPSTDVGKKDLPVGLRNRFTEFYVEELTDKNDLIKMVNEYFHTLNLDHKSIENIVNFYLNVRKEAVGTLSDGLGHKPHFSLRSLCRALRIASKNPCGTFKRSLYEAFCLSFLTQLNSASYQKVEAMILKYLIPDKEKKVLKELIPPPKNTSDEKLVQFEGYWIEKGLLETDIMSDYILTKCVKANLKDLVRIVSIGRLPILLQGDTSVGKTSLITYLAKASGFKCVRINNHEHTDLQEYVGSYVAAQDGKLVFQEGLLVQAMRQGHWIILDELNLAPSDVLEALNRVLDDNRELFIPETQQIVKAHPNFMLFATQNPPGMYGGRKMLSRAFRNRFVELHFNEIPHVELQYILHKRCAMPESYAKKMVKVMQELQMRRRGSAAFAGKEGFITLRDLFRWGERYRLAPTTPKLYDWDQHLADEGYLLLAGRVRKVEERKEIALVLQKYMKRDVDPNKLFTLSETCSMVTKDFLQKIQESAERYPGIVWTFNMRQLAVLVWKALQFHEPVLLVGETGGGKTTICNIIAQNNGQQLVTVNCHMHTESSDFIGALRPVRDHSDEDDNKLFEWIYGPLVHAMMDGNLFLADEISLADDSVLERLNSLLEPDRTLLIAEKGSDNNELVKAHNSFHFIGTMNPGGDFGKKELSPALRNRFTEIWCETCTDRQDLINIIDHNIQEDIKLDESMHHSGIAPILMNFIEWFKTQEIGKLFTISIRDILTWVHFINTCGLSIGVPKAYIHGAYLTFLDSLGSGVTSTENSSTLQKFETKCLEFLKSQFKTEIQSTPVVIQAPEKFGIHPFYVECGDDVLSSVEFSFDAPTTFRNAERVLRALQLKKALLLEGSPGVGKTSLVTALARASRNQIFRINLSDQTDISDLFGADLPVEGGKAGQFAWRDGPLLQALKQGHWILLDELNLASQSVLEGLNACLDHRGEIYIPELGKTFNVKPGTRFFGCQNPLKQGGSRRGLPKSFLNRFTQVTLSGLLNQDLLHILENQFPNLPKDLLLKMVQFNDELNAELEKHTFGHRGAPWEFNLRDMTRWCEAIIKHEEANGDGFKPESLVGLLFVDRMRTAEDKDEIRRIFVRVFGCDIAGAVPVCFVTDADVILGDVKLSRRSDECNVSVIKQEETCLVLRNQLPVLRSLAYCVEMNWMSILVGPASCGKSSVVKTLAKLVGRTLRTLAVTSAMDTTDILGGFEQSDYTRHLDELSKDVEWTLLHIIRALYADDAADGRGGGGGDSGARERRASIALLCMRTLEKFIAVFRDAAQSSTMAEETKNFRAKLDHLDAILDSLINIGPALTDFHPRLRQLQRRGIEISQHVATEGSLNAGGKFEWVDSVLIKCLKEGSWLLVDNVNLCSPAVLDRLNALLEPNGVLTIGERGTDDNGRMITICPHPNFRLFLTMDPKNGDISRAMRNRGVEIFMLEKCMSEQASLFDVKSLIAKQGLFNEDLIRVLVEIHEDLNDLVPGEASNVSHLIHAAFLIAQQLQRGASILSAFQTSIADVYLSANSSYSSGTPEASQAHAAILDKICEHLLASTINERPRNAPNQITLRTKALENNSQLAHVEQQATLLLENFRTRTAASNEHMDASQYALIHFFSMATRADAELRLRYVRLHHAVLESQCRHFEFIKALQQDADDIALPLELRWVPDTKYHDADVCKRNRMFLYAYYSLYRGAFEPDGTGEQRIGPSGDKSSARKHGFTMLQYLISIRHKEIDGSRLDNALLQNVLHLCTQYDKFFNVLLHSDTVSMTNEQTIGVLSLLEYRFLLYKSLKVVVKTVDDIPDSITNVHVHYKWFIKHSIKNLLTVLNINYQDHRIQALTDLRSTVDQINSQLTQNFNVFKKVAKLYQNTVARKPPLTNAIQLEITPKIHHTLDMLDICNPKFPAKETLVILKTHRTATMLLKQHLTLDVEDSINWEHLQRANINMNELSQVGNEELRMLTILDYFIILKMLNTRNHTLNFDGLYDSITVPVRLASALQMFKESKDERLWHEVMIEMQNYLKHSVALSLRLITNEKDLIEKNVDTCRIDLHMPALSYLILESFLQENGVGNAKFGNYREVQDITQCLNVTLWTNMKALSDKKYDYVSNEINHLINGNKQFWIDFAKCLKVEIHDGVSIKDLHNCCQSALGKLQEDKRENEISAMQHVLRLLNENYEKLNQAVECDEHERLNNTADGYILLSYAKLLLHAQLPMMDTLSKVALRKVSCEKERNQFQELRLSYEAQNAIFTGNARGLHPLHPLAVRKSLQLAEKLAELGKYVAVRPDEAVYRKLHVTLQNALTTIFAPSKFLTSYTSLCASRSKLLTLTRSAIDDSADVDLQRLQLEARLAIATLTSYDNFIEEIRCYRCVYPDYLEPLLAAGAQLLHGFRLRIGLFEKLCGIYQQRQRAGFDAARVLLRVGKLPALSRDQPARMDVANYFVSDEVHRMLGALFGENGDARQSAAFDMLKCALDEMSSACRESVAYSHVFKKDLFDAYNRLVATFVDAWKQQQIDVEIKKNEAESLYKIRTKCDDKTEDELAAIEFEQLFPSYHDSDFNDFISKDLGDDPEKEDLVDEYAGSIKQEDIEYISQVHTEFMLAFTKTEWLNPKNVTLVFVNKETALLHKYKLLKTILSKNIECLSYTLDREMMGTLSVLLAMTHKFGSVDTFINEPRKKYNFYKHSNVAEVQNCYHLLKELETRVNELLDQWPEHPTLKTIMTVILRIFNFDITSPLPRFLTGLDILLTKCHEWEENAHTGVSLSMHFLAISQQIINWRKFEMANWKSSLDMVYDRMVAATYKYWFHLYDVMREYIYDQAFDVPELVSSLQKFILQSTIAEFPIRVRLLLAFHCHATYLKPCLTRDYFISIMWNLYKHYEQFIPNISQQLHTLRKPIEKKLKDYVKIVRWKDISYWALKETLDKTHKIIHKYMREFEAALKQPANQFMTNTNTSYENRSFKEDEEAKSTQIAERIASKRYYTVNVEKFVSMLSVSPVQGIDSAILANGSYYYQKMRSLCTTVITLCNYPNMIKELDYFIAQVIITSKHLQSLEVDKTLVKEKQISQAKGHLRQKQRALSDLFKALSKIGLSFRKGIVESKQDHFDSDYIIRPLDLSALLGHLLSNENDAQLLEAWESVEIYNRKAFMRLEILENVLKTPAKELGPQNIERCKGFALDLMQSASQQKRKLVTTSNQLYAIRHIQMIIETLAQEKQFISKEKVDDLRSVLLNIVDTINEVMIIMSAAPEEELSNSKADIPILGNPNSIVFQSNTEWKLANSLLTLSMSKIEQLFKILQRSVSIFFLPTITTPRVNVKYIAFDNISNITSLIDDIKRNLKEFMFHFGNIEVVSHIHVLIEDLETISLQDLHSTDLGDVNKYKRDIRKSVEAILFSIQNIAEKYMSRSTEQKEIDKDAVFEELQENQLNYLIVQEMHQEIDCLNIPNICRRINTILETVCSADVTDKKLHRDLLGIVAPFLDQLIKLYQFLIIQQVSAFRVTFKMSSVLLNIFIDLATKGFCIPPELEGDMKESESKVTSGMGLGDGEGEKDVSDKIESEDQLEDAQPAGQERKKDEDKDCKEEEKGIEMSDDFDSKLQDVEKNPDDEENSDDNDDKDSDAEEQMGDTDKGAEQLDKQIWGSDDEEPPIDEKEEGKDEERGDSGEKVGEQEMKAKDEQPSQGPEEDTKDGKDEKDKKEKEINEMEEPEFDDEQTDPYHGNQPELPDPEEFDLPDDLQLDDEGEQEEQGEDNPFDIDAMKEQGPDDIPEDKDKEEDIPDVDDDKKQNDDESEDEEGVEKNDQPKETETPDPDNQEQDEGKTENEVDNKSDEEPEKQNQESVYDQTQSQDNSAQAMDVDDATAADNVQINPAEQQKAQPTAEETCQEDNPDKEGVGQSQIEKSKTGHKGEANAKQDSQNKQQDIEEKKRNRPGETDADRCLGDNTEPVKKKMKTVDSKKNDKVEDHEDEESPEDLDAEIYKHIKEAKKSSTQVMDAVTQEQAEKLKEQQVPNKNEDEDVEEVTESQDTVPDDDKDKMDEEMSEVDKAKAEKIENEKKQKLEQQKAQGDILEEMNEMEVDGDNIETQTVSRSAESTYHTRHIGNEKPRSFSIQEIKMTREAVERQLSVWNVPPNDAEAELAWEKISSVTSSLAQELSEQLRLVLEPTQASRLKGDFRTGRRINMRKVIPYIASQFRKDKIWLRRTKPSKREYQIVLAIDDSSSMADNHSKELAFESVALISKALTLLESGQLSILSFGEDTQVLHKLTDTFTDKSGSRLLQQFKFEQQKTCVAKMVEFATEMLNSTHSSAASLLAKLLIIVSDGRGIFSEGETFVQQAVRRAKLENIFMIFIIIDNPKTNNSILDIRKPVFQSGKVMEIVSYMDTFPFPFYIVLRDINTMPHVLSDALRQWFEMVSNVDRV